MGARTYSTPLVNEAKGRTELDIQTLLGVTLSSMGLMLMVLFGIIERYEPHVLLYMLVNPRKPAWATWLLSVTAALFAQRTALHAMGYWLEEEMSLSPSVGTESEDIPFKESDELRPGRGEDPYRFGPAQEQMLTQGS